MQTTPLKDGYGDMWPIIIIPFKGVVFLLSLKM